MEYELLRLQDLAPGQWIKLPWAVMQETGPAAQTFGGLLRITNKEMYRRVEEIAELALLPLRTVRNHLLILDQLGWIKNKGREKASSGRLRRTATIALTTKARESLEPYGVLPWWACGHVIDKRRKLSWGAKAVLSLVMSRLLGFTSAIQRNEEYGMNSDDPEEMADSMERLGGDDRFRMGLRWIEEKTGLTRETIGHAKRELVRAKLVQWFCDSPTDTHILAPNWKARIVVTPAGVGKVKLHIEEVEK